jgi:prepilin-type N-terminal cleavage/methylation domain-containing protein
MRSGFSLLELLIVIVIMGVVYTLGVENLQKLSPTAQEKKLSLQNLKNFLLQYDFAQEARIVCIDTCSECRVILDKKEQKSVPRLFQKTPVLYHFDPVVGYETTEAVPYFDEEGVEHDTCFSYTLLKNGVGEQLVVEVPGGVYDLGAYFDTGVYESMERFKENKEALLMKVML